MWFTDLYCFEFCHFRLHGNDFERKLVYRTYFVKSNLEGIEN